MTLVECMVGFFELNYHKKEEGEGGIEKGAGVVTNADPLLPKLDSVPCYFLFCFPWEIVRIHGELSRGMNVFFFFGFKLSSLRELSLIFYTWAWLTVRCVIHGMRCSRIRPSGWLLGCSPSKTAWQLSIPTQMGGDMAFLSCHDDIDQCGLM